MKLFTVTIELAVVDGSVDLRDVAQELNGEGWGFPTAIVYEIYAERAKDLRRGLEDIETPGKSLSYTIAKTG